MLETIVNQIQTTRDITKEQLNIVLSASEEEVSCLYQAAREVSQKVYGNRIYIRGLIEFSNYCKNNCYYCGIRLDNPKVCRFRLSQEEILSCCKKGYALGFRTFVLQSGEDGYYSDDRMVSIIQEIRKNYPDCAITLSIGERSKEAYERFYQAGANRYLLRHEAANKAHYQSLHPEGMSWENRMECLKHLKDIGYQVGCGFMVGSPKQTVDTLYEDLQFIRKLHPHMVGIGPFMPQKDTPFGQEAAGSLSRTLRLLSILRLLIPELLLPATTALGSLDPKGRSLGILSGANVVMPNLSPEDVRDKYALYDNKKSIAAEAAEGLEELRQEVQALGYCVVEDRGDSLVE